MAVSAAIVARETMGGGVGTGDIWYSKGVTIVSGVWSMSRSRSKEGGKGKDTVSEYKYTRKGREVTSPLGPAKPPSRYALSSSVGADDLDYGGD
jgi:hypothetical protein